MIRTAILPALMLLAPVLIAQGGARGGMAAPPVSSTPNMGVSEYSGNTSVTSLQHNDAADFARLFPPTEVGQTSEWVRIVVSNGLFAGAPVNLTTPVVATGAGDFILDTSNLVTTGVAAGNSTEFLIAYSPQGSYAVAGTVEFDYQPDPTGQPAVWSTFTINVQGNGVATPTAWLSVRENSLTGDRIFVGQQGLGARDLGRRVYYSGPGNSVQVFLVNEGSAGASTITVGTPTLISGTTDLVLDTTGFTGSLAAGASTSFTVTFDPSQTGSFSSIFEFTHSDGYAPSPFQLEFTGYGIDTPFAMYVTDQPGAWWVTGGAMVPFYTGTVLMENAPAAGNRDFGQVSSSASQVIQIDNGDAGYMDINLLYTPGADLVLGTPTVVGDPDFTLNLGGYSTTVASAGTTTFSVIFTPQANGVRSAVIEIPHNDSSERAPFRVHVTGEGVNVGSGGSGSGGSNGGGGCSSGGHGTSVWLVIGLLGGLAAVARLRRA